MSLISWRSSASLVRLAIFWLFLGLMDVVGILMRRPFGMMWWFRQRMRKVKWFCSRASFSLPFFRKPEQEEDETPDKEGKKQLFIPYIKGVSEKIERICHPLGVQVICKSRNNLRQSLMKVKSTRPDELKKGVVYEVPCADCECVYIGEIGRSLEMRLKEQVRCQDEGFEEWHSSTRRHPQP